MENPREEDRGSQKGYYRASSSVTSSLVMTTCSGTSCQENLSLQRAGTDPTVSHTPTWEMGTVCPSESLHPTL